MRGESRRQARGKCAVQMGRAGQYEGNARGDAEKRRVLVHNAMLLFREEKILNCVQKA